LKLSPDFALGFILHGSPQSTLHCISSHFWG